MAFRLFRHAVGWKTARLRRAIFVLRRPLLALCAALASTINLKGAHFSTDRTLTENRRQRRHRLRGGVVDRQTWTYGAYYKTMGEDEALPARPRLLAEPGSQFTEENNSIRRPRGRRPGAARLNVVILMEESPRLRSSGAAWAAPTR